MALAIFASLFTSCQKETIAPTPIDEISTQKLSKDASSITIKNQDFLPESPVNIDITVTSTPCSAGGYTLTVTSPDVDLADGSYTINWYKNTLQDIYSVGPELECVCGFGVRIEVLDESENLIAETSLDIPGC